VTLERLRQAVFTFFGIQEQPVTQREPDRDVEQQIRAFAQPLPNEVPSMSTGQVLTKAESAAWLAAGMPSPFEGWLKEYRRGRR
jgi:hypothetical protein